MAVLPEAKIMGASVGSAPEMVSEVVSITVAGPRDIGAGAVEAFHWRTYMEISQRHPLFSF